MSLSESGMVGCYCPECGMMIAIVDTTLITYCPECGATEGFLAQSQPIKTPIHTIHEKHKEEKHSL